MLSHWECYVRHLSCFWGTNGCFCWPHRLPNDPTIRLESFTVRLLWRLVRLPFCPTGTHASGGEFDEVLRLPLGVPPPYEQVPQLQCPPYLQQTNMPPTKTNISGGGTDIMTDITGSHASGGEFDEVLRLALGVPPLYEQVPQPPCSPCFPSVVTSTAAMVTLSP